MGDCVDYQTTVAMKATKGLGNIAFRNICFFYKRLGVESCDMKIDLSFLFFSFG
jgi:hypothetical protein